MPASLQTSLLAVNVLGALQRGGVVGCWPRGSRPANVCALPRLTVLPAAILLAAVGLATVGLTTVLLAVVALAVSVAIAIVLGRGGGGNPSAGLVKDHEIAVGLSRNLSGCHAEELADWRVARGRHAKYKAQATRVSNTALLAGFGVGCRRRGANTCASGRASGSGVADVGSSSKAMGLRLGGRGEGEDDGGSGEGLHLEIVQR